MSTSSLTKCRRVVSGSVDELSQDLSTNCLKKCVDELFCRPVVLFPKRNRVDSWILCRNDSSKWLSSKEVSRHSPQGLTTSSTRSAPFFILTYDHVTNCTCLLSLHLICTLPSKHHFFSDQHNRPWKPLATLAAHLPVAPVKRQSCWRNITSLREKKLRLLSIYCSYLANFHLFSVQTSNTGRFGVHLETYWGNQIRYRWLAKTLCQPLRTPKM